MVKGAAHVPAYVVVEPAGAPSSERGRRSTWLTAAATRAIAEHEGVILPSDPSVEPSAPITIAVPDFEHASRLADALRGMAAVRAAYPKPGEELP
jgi:hypothetical protein